MHPLRKEEAHDILDPFLSRIRNAVYRAVSSYYSGVEYSNVRHLHSARSAASLCHDHIKSHIRSEFESDPEVHISERRGLFTIAIRGSVVLRFKKFNKNLLSSGIKTHQLTAFNLQDPAQLELDGMPPDGLLHVGYVLNSLGTGIKDVYITYRYGNINIWEMPLAETVIEPVLFPAPAAATSTRSRKVKAKGVSSADGDENASNS